MLYVVCHLYIYIYTYYELHDTYYILHVICDSESLRGLARTLGPPAPSDLGGLLLARELLRFGAPLAASCTLGCRPQGCAAAALLARVLFGGRSSACLLTRRSRLA